MAKGNDLKFKVVVYQGGTRVEAPLPDMFGVGVGADISSPFSSFSGDNTISNLAAAGGITTKVGLFVKKIYMSPEQPDFTLDLKFATYKSAYDDVLVPVKNLMNMTTSSEKATEKAAEKTGTQAGKSVSQFVGDLKNKYNAQNFLTYLESPNPVSIRFGNIYTVRNCLIANVQPQFGNVLDAAGHPMYAEVSITFVLVDMLKRGDVNTMFKDLQKYNRKF